MCKYLIDRVSPLPFSEAEDSVCVMCTWFVRSIDVTPAISVPTICPEILRGCEAADVSKAINRWGGGRRGTVIKGGFEELRAFHFVSKGSVRPEAPAACFLSPTGKS